jgi:hypothetical protein
VIGSLKMQRAREFSFHRMRRRQWISITLSMFTFFLGMVLILFIDAVMTMNGLYARPFPISPYLIILCLCALAAVPIWGFNLERSRPIRVAWICAVVLMGAGICVFADGTRKSLQRDLARIRMGMTQTEVKRIMIRWIPGTGFPANPLTGEKGELSLPQAMVYRPTNEGWGDAEWGIIRFDAHGKVAGIDYSPD